MATENMPLLAGDELPMVPAAHFTCAIAPPETRPVPQTIAHRGYKAAFPENSMAAFQGALAVGAHALETDLHLSKDGVVVLSHDPTLKRCFGREERIAECEWSFLSTLKTVREPQQGLPRLLDLLEWLAQPSQLAVWVLLDIKTNDDAESLLGCLAETIASVPSARDWKERIVLGCWNENYINLSAEYLPGFPIAYIGFSLPYASRFLSSKYANVNFNLLQKMLVGPVGGRFMKGIRDADRRLYVWTVNEERWMEWSIRKGVDGVITDDPKLFREVCSRYLLGDQAVVLSGGSWARRTARTIKMYSAVFMWQVLALFLSVAMWRRFTTRGRRAKGKGRGSLAKT